MGLPKGAIVLCIIGALIAACGYGLGSVAVERKYKDVRRGWTLSRTMVASVDIPAGSELTAAQLEPRDIPEQFITKSVVSTPDTLIGKRTAIALPKGTAIPAGALTDVGACP